MCRCELGYFLLRNLNVKFSKVGQLIWWHSFLNERCRRLLESWWETKNDWTRHTLYKLDLFARLHIFKYLCELRDRAFGLLEFLLRHIFLNVFTIRFFAIRWLRHVCVKIDLRDNLHFFFSGYSWFHLCNLSSNLL